MGHSVLPLHILLYSSLREPSGRLQPPAGWSRCTLLQPISKSMKEVRLFFVPFTSTTRRGMDDAAFSLASLPHAVASTVIVDWTAAGIENTPRMYHKNLLLSRLSLMCDVDVVVGVVACRFVIASD